MTLPSDGGILTLVFSLFLERDWTLRKMSAIL